VLHDELQLLQATVIALRFRIELAVGRVASPVLGLFLIGARVFLDLLAQVAHLEPQGVGDGIKLRVEIVELADSAGVLFRGRSIAYGIRRSTNPGARPSTVQPDSIPRIAIGSLGRTRIDRMPRLATTSGHPGSAAMTVW